MLNFLLGPDGFSKEEYVVSEAARIGAVIERYYSDGELPVQSFLQQDIFSKLKCFVLLDAVKRLFVRNDLLENLMETKNSIFVVESKLDKRIAAVKHLLSDKRVQVKDFQLPHGKELDLWIIKRAQKKGVKLSQSVADYLAKKLGRDEAVETKFGGRVVEVREAFTLWQADSELNKLAAFSGKEAVSEADVDSLVSQNWEIDVLTIVDAIATNQKQRTLSSVGRFLNRGGDEKSLIIQLNALLSEQFRNIAMTQGFLAERVSDAKILELTGWKSGRLFIMKKNAAKFNFAKVFDLLEKFRHLDQELKSSSIPPRVLLDLILSQLFV
jgi:DNA polymerase III delta subunit